MNDFDKYFSDDLRREHDFEPSENGWKNLSTDLDREDFHARFLRFWLPGLAAVLAVIFLTFGWWRSDRRVDFLEKKVAKIESHLEKQAILIQKVVGEDANNGGEKIETNPKSTNLSFRRNLPEEKAGISSPFSSRFSQNDRPKLENEPAGIFQNDRQKLKNEPAKFFQNDFQNGEIENGKIAHRSRVAIAFLPSKNLQPIDFHLNKSKTAPPTAQFFLTENLIKPVKIPRFALGATAGFVFSDDEKMAAGFGKTLGLTGQFLLKKHWRLTADLDFETTKSGSHRHFDFPNLTVPNPPAPDFTLNKIKVRQSAAVISLGIRRDFLEKKRLHPFVSLGWSGVWKTAQQVDFQFFNENTRETAVVPKQDFQTNISAGNLRGGIGAAWKFSQKLELNFETGWRGEFSEHNKSDEGAGWLRLGILKKW